METVEDLLKSLKSIMYERFTSPIAIIFLLSWCVCNWQLIYYLFTVSPDITTENRISYIQKTYINEQLNIIINPLASTIIMTFGYPLISYASHRIKEYTNSKKRKSREYFIHDKLLTFDQSRRLSELIFNLQKRNEEILRERTDSEHRLREEKDTLVEEKLLALKDLDDQTKTFRENNLKLKNEIVESDKHYKELELEYKKQLNDLDVEKTNDKLSSKMGNDELRAELNFVIAEAKDLKQELEGKEKNLQRFVDYSGSAISGFGKIMAILKEHTPSRVRLGGDIVKLPMVDYGEYELIVKLIDESIPPNIYLH